MKRTLVLLCFTVSLFGASDGFAQNEFEELLKGIARGILQQSPQESQREGGERYLDLVRRQGQTPGGCHYTYFKTPRGARVKLVRCFWNAPIDDLSTRITRMASEMLLSSGASRISDEEYVFIPIQSCLLAVSEYSEDRRTPIIRVSCEGEWQQNLFAIRPEAQNFDGSVRVVFDTLIGRLRNAPIPNRGTPPRSGAF